MDIIKLLMQSFYETGKTFDFPGNFIFYISIKQEYLNRFATMKQPAGVL